MTITKIEDLDIYYAMGMNIYDENIIDEHGVGLAPIYYRNEVEELVNHLQSKLPTWNKFDKNNPPGIERKVFILTNIGSIHTAWYDWDSGFAMYLFTVYLGNAQGTYFNEVTHWCYADDFNKAFQTGE